MPQTVWQMASATLADSIVSTDDPLKVSEQQRDGNESKIFMFIRRMTAVQRLLREYAEIQTQKRTDVHLQEWNCSVNQWVLQMSCPRSPIWNKAVFEIELTFTPDYPRVFPRVRFVNQIPFHPNVADNGEICLGSLPRSNRCSVLEIVEAIQALMDVPNSESPTNMDALELFTHSFGEYRHRAEQFLKFRPIHLIPSD
jgi:ubiquitin-protein ligase